MSALTERVSWGHYPASVSARGTYTLCACDQDFPQSIYYAEHVAEIVERQVRAQIAAEIRVEMRWHDNAQVGFSAVGDAYAHAARIAEGTQ